MKKNMFRLLILQLVIFLLAGISYAQTIIPETALQSYINNGDSTFHWKMVDKLKAHGVKAYRLVFTSQEWQNIEWKHELVVIVPGRLKYKDALLFITGGSMNKNGKPNLHGWDEGMTKALAEIAKHNRAVTAILWQVPNQPLYDNLTEDALISYTLHNYRNDGDYNWPLLFPMTKSAVRAMDVVQELTEKKCKRPVSDFLVAGASKRGWTTWLTGAADSRVKAIAPMVIDMLNMPVSMAYQKEVWGDYSVQIEDYIKLGIVQNLEDPKGMELVKMIDPYSYRDKLTMPKMLFMGTNDEYWPVDAVKNYIDDIPGDNRIHYVANAGHDLGNKKQALEALNAFFSTTLTGEALPPCEYKLTEDEGKIELNVTAAPELLKDIILWTSVSEDRDFRDEKWKSEKVEIGNQVEIRIDIEYPLSGFKAFYIDLEYKAPFGSDYTQSTRMFVADTNRYLK